MRGDRPVPSRLPAGVAAGHQATVDAGIEILEAGGGAADAAVAASLASCVAETVMTGLLGGGHAVYCDRGGAADEVETLDFFVAAPGLDSRGGGAEMLRLEVPFGVEIVHYAVGVASCGVPGVPAGLERLWQRHGRLPWPRLVEPALRLARSGVRMPSAHAACLEMLAPVMTMRDGARMYAPGGRLLRAGDELRQPGLAAAFELLAREGASTVYRGTLAESLLALMEERGGLVTRTDLQTYEPIVGLASSARFGDLTVCTREGLSSPLPVFERLASGAAGASAAERALRLVRALAGADAAGHTTNVTAVDRDGNACVVTTSLGLGSGDWIPGYDLHLNSMLGEADLLTGELPPGARMASMMAPTVVLDERDDLVLAIGAAGGTRLRSALVQVALGVLEEGLAAGDAVRRPRLHRAGDVVHVEPGFADEVLAVLQTGGFEVRAWPALHHYFGGVSLITRSGAAGDPRRSGGARTLP
jgi:gamma-glutamyltranspeptidase / glutathione hydrolase